MTMDLNKHIRAAILGVSLAALTAGGYGTLTGATLGGAAGAGFGAATHSNVGRSAAIGAGVGDGRRFTTSSAAAEHLTVTYYD